MSNMVTIGRKNGKTKGDIEIVGLEETKPKLTTLAIAYFPDLGSGAKLVVGIHTPKGIQTINEFKGRDATGLFHTLTDPKIKNTVNLEGRK